MVSGDVDMAILPPTSIDMSAKGGKPQLSAANGSSIATFGTRLVIDCLHGCHFEWDFVIASVTVPIIRTDFFFCANS